MSDKQNKLTYNREKLSELKTQFCPSDLKSFLKIAHVNVENLTVHRDSFFSLFYEDVFDIVVVTETFLKPTVSSKPYNVEGYNLIRHDREEKEGGGLGIYIKKIFSYNVIATSNPKYCKNLSTCF